MLRTLLWTTWRESKPSTPSFQYTDNGRSKAVRRLKKQAAINVVRVDPAHAALRY
jgi:hypothetical protein